jgi:hypothetical protein
VLATIIGSGAKRLVQITVDPTTEREAADEDTGSEAEGEQVEQSGIPGPVAAGDVIIATDGHPFWVSDLEQWVDAVDLAPGTWLQTSSGTWVQVSAVQAWTQPATVHNLTVQGVHTFHVAAGDLNVLNHNCEPAFLDDVSEKYVRDKHAESGSMRDEAKGYFYDSEDLYELADRPEPFGANVQLNGNCVRVCDTGRLVGTEARTDGGAPTSTYTVISDKWGGVITMHPGGGPDDSSFSHGRCGGALVVSKCSGVRIRRCRRVSLCSSEY